MGDPEVFDYEVLKQKFPLVASVIHEKAWNMVTRIKEDTNTLLRPSWIKQIKINSKRLYKKHGSIRRGVGGLGVNKAVIGIGAGPSFNLNKQTLKRLSDANLQLRLDDQPFVFITSNHMLKPCMEYGIYPHFVILCDASDVVFNQLCVDLPKGPKPILLTTLQASPKVLNEWDRQGNCILFYMPRGEEEQAVFKKVTGEDPSKVEAFEGGNVMNVAWVISRKFLNSTVFMVVGNDLGYPWKSKELNDRRQGYYADGDYSSNIANRRDEARYGEKWMGFEFVKSYLDNSYLTQLKLMGTSPTLFVYKVWIESQVMANSGNRCHYYNCSEQGILGVCAKSYDKDAMMDRQNWYLLDEMIPKTWHTRRLEDAARQFVEARECLRRRQEIPTGANAGLWLPRMDTAKYVDPRPSGS